MFLIVALFGLVSTWFTVEPVTADRSLWVERDTMALNTEAIRRLGSTEVLFTKTLGYTQQLFLFIKKNIVIMLSVYTN